MLLFGLVFVCLRVLCSPPLHCEAEGNLELLIPLTPLLKYWDFTHARQLYTKGATFPAPFQGYELQNCMLINLCDFKPLGFLYSGQVAIGIVCRVPFMCLHVDSNYPHCAFLFMSEEFIFLFLDNYIELSVLTNLGL